MAKRGFTLVELSLSVAFIGILSIAVALIMNDTIAAYRRGMILNQINTMGIDLVDDLRAAVQNSSIKSVENLCGVAYTNTTRKTECENDNARNFTTVERLSNVTIRGTNTSNVSVFGAFCTGSYSYIWNSGYFFSSDANMGSLQPAYLRYKAEGGEIKTYPEDTSKPFKLIKIKDNTRAVCMTATFYHYNNSGSERYYVKTQDRTSTSANINDGSNIFDLTQSTSDYSVAELGENDIVDVIVGESNMVLYDLRAMPPAINASNNGSYYSVSFVLGTIQGGVNVKTAGNYCVPPKDYNKKDYANFDYCAINKFNFAVQATGE